MSELIPKKRGADVDANGHFTYGGVAVPIVPVDSKPLQITLSPGDSVITKILSFGTGFINVEYGNGKKVKRSDGTISWRI
jgi:hypothetical protein